MCFDLGRSISSGPCAVCGPLYLTFASLCTARSIATNAKFIDSIDVHWLSLTSRMSIRTIYKYRDERKTSEPYTYESRIDRSRLSREGLLLVGHVANASQLGRIIEFCTHVRSVQINGTAYLSRLVARRLVGVGVRRKLVFIRFWCSSVATVARHVDDARRRLRLKCATCHL